MSAIWIASNQRCINEKTQTQEETIYDRCHLHFAFLCYVNFTIAIIIFIPAFTRYDHSIEVTHKLYFLSSFCCSFQFQSDNCFHRAIKIRNVKQCEKKTLKQSIHSFRTKNKPTNNNETRSSYQHYQKVIWSQRKAQLPI